MNSPSARSPSYRHIASKHKHSPIELKEKMRKSYKDKVQNCRNMLLNRLRGTETDLRDTLTDIYNRMFNFSADPTITDEEHEIMEEIRKELVQEELQCWAEKCDVGFGAVVRWRRVAKCIFYLELEEGKRKNGGQLLRFKYLLKRYIKKCYMVPNHWEQLAAMRPEWRALVKSKVFDF